VTAFVSADDVTVRDATDRDVGRIVELLDLGSLAEGKEDPLDRAPYVAALAEIRRQPGGVLVADWEGRVVGVCQLIVFRHIQSHGALCAETSPSTCAPTSEVTVSATS
jgi:hypothetical protein